MRAAFFLLSPTTLWRGRVHPPRRPPNPPPLHPSAATIEVGAAHTASLQPRRRYPYVALSGAARSPRRSDGRGGGRPVGRRRPPLDLIRLRGWLSAGSRLHARHARRRASPPPTPPTPSPRPSLFSPPRARPDLAHHRVSTPPGSSTPTASDPRPPHRRPPLPRPTSCGRSPRLRPQPRRRHRPVIDRPQPRDRASVEVAPAPRRRPHPRPAHLHRRGGGSTRSRSSPASFTAPAACRASAPPLLGGRARRRELRRGQQRRRQHGLDRRHRGAHRSPDHRSRRPADRAPRPPGRRARLRGERACGDPGRAGAGTRCRQRGSAANPRRPGRVAQRPPPPPNRVPALPTAATHQRPLSLDGSAILVREIDPTMASPRSRPTRGMRARTEFGPPAPRRAPVRRFPGVMDCSSPVFGEEVPGIPTAAGPNRCRLPRRLLDA